MGPQAVLNSKKGLNKKALATLQEIVVEAAKNSEGEACIFNICTELTNWLLSNNIAEKTMHEEMMNRASGAAVAERGGVELSEKEKDRRSAEALLNNEDMGLEEVHRYLPSYSIIFSTEKLFFPFFPIKSQSRCRCSGA